MEDLELIECFIKTIQKYPLTTLNRELLAQWYEKLIGWKTYIGQQNVGYQRQYNRRMKEIRMDANVKSKADAEILANDTDEWENWQKTRRMYDDIGECINVVKKAHELYEEEFRENKFING